LACQTARFYDHGELFEIRIPEDLLREFMSSRNWILKKGYV